MAYEPGTSDTSPLGGPTTHDGGVDKRQATRLAVAGVALLAAVLFVVQNSNRVRLDFLFFSVRTPLWVGLIVTLLLGAILGQAVEALVTRRRRARAAD